MPVISVELIPLLVVMVVVVPLTYRFVLGVLEHQLHFHTLLSKNILRPLEVVLSVMLFPSALLYIFVMTVYMALVSLISLVAIMLNYVTSSKWLFRAFYGALFITVYLLLIVVFINVIRYLYLEIRGS